MKIIIFSWRDIKHPSAGGAEIATHEHAKYWVNKGHEVIVFSSSFEGASTEDVIDGVKFVRKGNQLGSVYIHAFVWYLRLLDKPDVVVDQIHGIGFFTPIYVRVPTLTYIHEVAREVWFLNELRFPLNYIYGFLGYTLEPIMYRLIYRKSAFMTVSDSTANDLERMGINKENIHIVLNGVNTLPTKMRKNNIKTATYLGSLAKDKGIFEAIEIFGELAKLDSSWKFWIVGNGTQKIIDQVVLMAKKLTISKNLKIWGYVPQTKKFELLAKSHVMINPSQREGWGLVNIEANSVGTPVLGYDVSGVRDSIRNGVSGYIVERGNIKKMAKLANKILLNRVNYNKLSKSSVEWSQNFKWDKSSRQCLEILKNL